MSPSGPRPLAPDAATFRTVLGHFPSGVVLITAFDGAEPVGMACNSFTSVSLEPQLVLFCAAKSSTTWPRIQAAGKWAANFLDEDGEEICRLFAQKGADRFGQTPWHCGVSGAPVLDDAIAYIDCDFEAEYPGGDHKIIVGRVLDLDMREGARPLLFYKGSYSKMHPGE